MFATDYVLNAFLNHSCDCDEIWYRDRLDLREKDRLHIVTKNVNKRSNPRMFSNRDTEIIIIIFFFYINGYYWF